MKITRIKKIKTIVDLRNDLLDVYESLRSATITLKDAKERANLAGKLTATAKLQLDYNSFMKSQKKIDFLEDGTAD